MRPKEPDHAAQGRRLADDQHVCTLALRHLAGSFLAWLAGAQTGAVGQISPAS